MSRPLLFSDQMGKGEKRKLNPADEFRKKQRQKELKKVRRCGH